MIPWNKQAGLTFTDEDARVACCSRDTSIIPGSFKGNNVYWATASQVSGDDLVRNVAYVARPDSPLNALLPWSAHWSWQTWKNTLRCKRLLALELLLPLTRKDSCWSSNLTKPSTPQCLTPFFTSRKFIVKDNQNNALNLLQLPWSIARHSACLWPFRLSCHHFRYNISARHVPQNVTIPTSYGTIVSDDPHPKCFFTNGYNPRQWSSPNFFQIRS